MQRLPCKDCICLAICKPIVLEKSPKIGGEIFSKCDLINKYVLTRKQISNKELIHEIEISIKDDRLNELLEYMKNA